MDRPGRRRADGLPYTGGAVASPGGSSAASSPRRNSARSATGGLSSPGPKSARDSALASTVNTSARRGAAGRGTTAAAARTWPLGVPGGASATAPAQLAGPRTSPREAQQSAAPSGPADCGADDEAAGGPTAVGIHGALLFHTIQQLATLEATLWSILEGMQSNATYVAFFCREYWGTSASKAMLSLEKLRWNERLKRQVQQACVLECLGLAVTAHLCSGTMQDVSVTIRSRLRNLMYYIHMNTLVLLDLIWQRWQLEQNGGWTNEQDRCHRPENLTVDILVRVKRYRQLRKGEHAMALRQHNETISNIVRQLCRGASLRGQSAIARNTRSPVATGRGSVRGQSPQPNLLGAANDVLTGTTPLDRLRARTVRNQMLNFMRFRPLLNVDGGDPDSPWPAQDPYERFGADQFPENGPVIWFEPLPPMMADLDRSPELPAPRDPDAYTLVLDLDETLVHYYESDGVGNYRVRPGMYEFLQRMSSLGYELVIFTAATQDYADWIVDQIDPDGLVQYRLYRQHAMPWGPLFVKDLRRVGRNLDRTLIIDNVQENFMLQPNNGIFICTWCDDPQDNALFALTPLLDELITTKCTVPDILDKYHEQIPSWAGFDRFLQLQDGGAPADYSEFDLSFDGAVTEDDTPQAALGNSALPPTAACHGVGDQPKLSQQLRQGDAQPQAQRRPPTHAAQQRQATPPAPPPTGAQAAVGPASQTATNSMVGTPPQPRYSRPQASPAGPYQAAQSQPRVAWTGSGISGPLQAPPPQRQTRR